MKISNATNLFILTLYVKVFDITGYESVVFEVTSSSPELRIGGGLFAVYDTRIICDQASQMYWCSDLKLSER